MAFDINYMSRVSSSGNTEGLKVWSYNGSSSGANDTVAEIVAAGYFNDFMQNLTDGLGPLAIGDTIIVSGSDGNGMYKVSDVTTNVEVAAFAAANAIDTANLVDGAVTFAKMQDIAATSLLGNSTGGSDVVEEIGLGSGLEFNSTDIQIPASYLRHAQVALTLAEFIAGYSAPKLLVAAPGSGKKIILHRASLAINYGGTVLAAGGAASIQYDSTVHAGGTQATGTQAAATLIAATADTSFGFTPVDTTLTDSTTLNKGLYWAMATADFTGGTNSLYWIDLWYSVVDVN